MHPQPGGLLPLLHNNCNLGRRALQQIHTQLVTAAGQYRDSPLLWDALLRHYSFGAFPREALSLFKHHHLNHGRLSSPPPSSCSPSLHASAFTSVLKACANLRSAAAATQLHALSFRAGFQFNLYVQTTFVGAYSACGSLARARQVFDEMPDRSSVTWNVLITGLIRWGDLDLARSLFLRMPAPTVVSWTSLIDGYARRDRPQPRGALYLFRKMIARARVRPNQVTVLAVSPAVSTLGDVRICKCIHAYCEKSGIMSIFHVRVANSLLDMYAKCGCVVSASRVFEEIPTSCRTLVSWTSMISGFAMHGMSVEAVENLKRMKKASVRPNRVTFLSILNACSHGGLVEEGLKFFNSMVEEGQVRPDIKHYGCLIDMLGRAGRLEEAERMALEIGDDEEKHHNVVIWRTILGACSFHGDVEMGERVFRKIVAMERAGTEDYVLMSNIFAGAGRFRDTQRTRKQINADKASKCKGVSSV